jgi:hypothetical protein
VFHSYSWVRAVISRSSYNRVLMARVSSVWIILLRIVVWCGASARGLSSSKCSYRFCGPPRLLFSEYLGIFSLGWSSRGLKLTTHLHLVRRSGMSGPAPLVPRTPSWQPHRQLHLRMFDMNAICVQSGRNVFSVTTVVPSSIGGPKIIFWCVPENTVTSRHTSKRCVGVPTISQSDYVI